MPVKVKQSAARRSNTGLTNKAETVSGATKQPSTNSRVSTPALAAATSKECVCKVCTCGKHRCTGTNFSAMSSSVANSPLEKSTESHDQYCSKELPKLHSFKPEHKMPPQQNLEGISATKEQFVHHQLPAKIPPHRELYQPNPAPLEDKSEQKSAYKQWPATAPPTKYKKTEYKPSPHLMDTESTTRHDYPNLGVVERVKARKNPEEYKPPTGDLAKLSVSHEQYVSHNDQLRSPVKHERQVYIGPKEDRDFSSTTHTDYPLYQADSVQRPAQIKREQYQPVPGGLESMSTKMSDYVLHDAASIRRANPINPNQRSAASDRIGNIKIATSSSDDPSSSVYTAAYTKHDTKARVVGKPMPSSNAHTHPELGLEGTSSVHDSYRNPTSLVSAAEAYERRSFKPEHHPNGAKEERDFVTVTKAGYTPKEIKVCPVLVRTDVSREKAEDGHVYFNGGVAAVKPAVVAV